MTGFTTLDGDDTGSNKIARSATAAALYNNPIAIAQRDSAAPWLNGIGAITSLTSGSGNWTVPAGVYRIKVTAIGGGSGGQGTGSASTAGGSTTFSTLTANGGALASGGTPGSGGTATGGDINITGQSGSVYGVGGASILGNKGAGGSSCGTPAGGGGGGGGGGTAIKVFTVNPANSLSYSVGSGGAGGNAGGGSYAGESGTGGIIIIEY